jgi:hypothetical protein
MNNFSRGEKFCLDLSDWDELFFQHEILDNIEWLRLMPFYEFEVLVHLCETCIVPMVLHEYDTEMTKKFIIQSSKLSGKRINDLYNRVGGEVPYTLEQEVQQITQNYYRVYEIHDDNTATFVFSTFIIGDNFGIINKHVLEQLETRKLYLSNAFFSCQVTLCSNGSKFVRSEYGFIDVTIVQFVGLPSHQSMIHLLNTPEQTECSDILLSYVPGEAFILMTLQLIDKFCDLRGQTAPSPEGCPPAPLASFGMKSLCNPGSCGSLMLRYGPNGLSIFGIFNLGMFAVDSEFNSGFVDISDIDVSDLNELREFVPEYDNSDFQEDSVLSFKNLMANDKDSWLFFSPQDTMSCICNINM